MKHARLILSALAGLAILATGCGTSPLARQATGLSASRPVAHATKLRAVPAQYYAAAEGQKGRALLEALNRTVSQHKDLGYDGARDVMFGQADDLDNDNVVIDCYLGRALDNVTNRSTAYRNGKGLNAEHTWPQSKGAEGVAKSDLHHLFSADVLANSTRGSFPFGLVKNPDWAEGGSRRGTNENGDIVFEPRSQHRGNVARAILYFYTVYGLNGGLDTENLRIEEPVLKRWHTEDPVDANELARNDVVFSAQGNRNPYVDRPEFVGAVGTFLGSARR